MSKRGTKTVTPTPEAQGPTMDDLKRMNAALEQDARSWAERAKRADVLHAELNKIARDIKEMIPEAARVTYRYMLSALGARIASALEAYDPPQVYTATVHLGENKGGKWQVTHSEVNTSAK